jgi:hypothetical protein
LLLRRPTLWVDDNTDLLETYIPRFEQFVQALENVESERTPGVHEMSRLMRQSMADGTFWFNEASRQSFSFGYLWWDRLDGICFGPRLGSIMDRVEALCPAPMQKDVDSFVELKMKQLQDYNREYKPTLPTDAKVQDPVDTPETDGHEINKHEMSGASDPPTIRYTVPPQSQSLLTFLLSRWTYAVPMISLSAICIGLIAPRYYPLLWYKFGRKR